MVEMADRMASGKVLFKSKSYGDILDVKYDLVVCSNALEYVYDNMRYLEKCFDLVKPHGGYLFLSCYAKSNVGFFSMLN